MNIAVVASEAAPFARTGGLGDVVGALPRALARHNNRVKVFVPRYGSIDGRRFGLAALDWTVSLNVAGKARPLTVETAREKKTSLDHYFLGNEYFFDRAELYRDNHTGRDYADNDERFLFFARGVFETLKRVNFRPDVIHVHDWQAGLVPPFLKLHHAGDSFFDGTKTVLTIHNLAYQGLFDKSTYAKLELPADLFAGTGPFEFYGKVNYLKAAIIFADKITTVSEKYAGEIQSASELGSGLDGVLRERAADLAGILNGVDYSIWSPSRDRRIPFGYHKANLSGKRENKVALLGRAALPIREKTPLIGMISRLVDQKGVDLVAAVADRLMALNLQMIVLGEGEEKYHRLFTELQHRYPDKFRAYLKFDDDLAHLIEAGADIFLMPSRFEPCGLNQMYSLKYGTVPIVREVGGLADTVVDFDEPTGRGTGFVFTDCTPEALFDTVVRALGVYARKRVWTKIVKNGMEQDFSWDKSALKYQRLFETLLRV